LSQARGALHDPAVPAQPFTGVDHAPGDAGLDAAPAKVSPAEGIVAGLVGVELFRSAPRTSNRLADGRNGFNEILKKEAVVAVSGRELHRERDALPLDHKVALRARFAAIRRIRAGELPPLFAGTLALSSAARLQSIWLVSPRKLSSSW
jgi:hypothetical protein